MKSNWLELRCIQQNNDTCADFNFYIDGRALDEWLQ